MNRRLLAALALALLTAACSSTPDSSATAATDGSTTDRAPLARNDVIFDNDMSDTKGAAVPGSQEDLNAQAGDRVFFQLNSSELSPEGRATLEKQAAWLKQYANVGITIEGHCDERGTRDARRVEPGTTSQILAAVELLAQTPDLADVSEQPAKDGYLRLRATLSAAILAQWASETASTFSQRAW